MKFADALREFNTVALTPAAGRMQDLSTNADPCLSILYIRSYRWTYLAQLHKR